MKNLIKNKTFGALSVLAFVFMLMGCDEQFDDSAFNTNVPVNILAFEVNGIATEINDATGKITTQLPYGSNLTALVPNIELPAQALVNPGSDTPMDFTSIVDYQVRNGNIYKDYKVSITSQKPILSFAIDGLEASINHNSKWIALTLPEGTDLTQIQPKITLGEGVSISPNTDSQIDFSEPVTFTVTGQGVSEDYTAVVSTPVEGPVVAFLGVSDSRQDITNLDEKTASDWLFEHYTSAIYLSFKDILNGRDLEDIDVIWWHYDAEVSLPTIALGSDVVSLMKNYLSEGGNLLLTTFASQYLEPLGIVPSGKGPNNVFGDFLPNGFVDEGSWGMSFVGHEDHPIFAGLETYEPGKANLLESGTFRLNHTAWWFLPEWGGYENGEGWRNQTGGTNLASEAWDDQLNGRVGIAEFSSGTTRVNTLVISMGAYDWYNETDSNGNPSGSNGFIENIKILTANSLDYLADN